MTYEEKFQLNLVYYSFQVLTDIVYDPKNALIVTVLEKGDVLVFDSSTNPCQAKELLVPMVTEDSITCLALVKEVTAFSLWVSSSALLNSAQIIDFNANAKHHS